MSDTNLLDLMSGGNARLEELRTQESEPIKWIDNFDEHTEHVDQTGWPTDEEILELWHTYRGTSGYVGYTPTMREFGTWLAGTDACTEHSKGDFNQVYKPAEVTW